MNRTSILLTKSGITNWSEHLQPFPWLLFGLMMSGFAIKHPRVGEGVQGPRAPCGTCVRSSHPPVQALMDCKLRSPAAARLCSRFEVQSQNSPKTRQPSIPPVRQKKKSTQPTRRLRREGETAERLVNTQMTVEQSTSDECWRARHMGRAKLEHPATSLAM